ncbi:hypothetical protein AAGG49_22565, partial [Stenotrophomonas maltophilia]|uniref:hypothetical protein n=1 Tax=Stenotrophomonas maltophilia TaxID=40324 RepID=UPI00313AF623
QGQLSVFFNSTMAFDVNGILQIFGNLQHVVYLLGGSSDLGGYFFVGVGGRFWFWELGGFGPGRAFVVLKVAVVT